MICTAPLLHHHCKYGTFSRRVTTTKAQSVPPPTSLNHSGCVEVGALLRVVFDIRLNKKEQNLLMLPSMVLPACLDLACQ